MGGFYGSIQVRTVDRAAVKVAVEKATLEKGIRCLLGPELNGWVGIYPEDGGQDDGVGKAVAQLVAGEVLQLMVHDDDVMAYWLWRGGELVDSYWSKPGILGEENVADEESRRGDAEQFRGIVGETVEKLAAILDRDQEYIIESQRLGKLAKCLGISNAVTAYEYLVSDEREGVKGWRKFGKIPPDPKIEKLKLPSAKPLRLKLKRSGLLIYFDERNDYSSFGLGCRLDEKFILGWANLHRANEFTQVSSPWDDLRIKSFTSPGYVRALKVDAYSELGLTTDAGSALVIAMSGGNWIELLPIVDDHLFGSAVSKSGNLVACAMGQHAVAIDLSTGKELGRFKWRNPSTMAIHPSGKWMVISGDALGIIELKSEPEMRLFYVGGNKPLKVGNAVIVEQPGCVGFSRSGRYYWCGTTVGLRVYEWDSLSSRSSRKTRWLLRFRDELPSFVEHQVTAIAEEPDGVGIVFGTFAGKLARFSLETGELFKLADLPNAGRVEHLILSADGNALAVGTDKETRKGPRSMPKHARAWEVWDYKRLRNSEVLRGRAEPPKQQSPREDFPEDLSQRRRAYARGAKSRRKMNDPNHSPRPSGG